PRTAQQQYLATHRVSPSELRPGDLVFFAQTYRSPREWITHVGIFLGGGRMLNAPVEGDVIREMPVFTGFWGAHYAGAGRGGGGPVRAGRSPACPSARPYRAPRTVARRLPGPTGVRLVDVYLAGLPPSTPGHPRHDLSAFCRWLVAAHPPPAD